MNDYKRETNEKHHDPIVNRVHNEARLFQEAWLNHVGLTRMVRWLLSIFITFLAITTFIQSKERDSCEANKPFLLALLHSQEDAIKRQDNVLNSKTATKTEKENAEGAKENAQAFAAVLKPVEHLDCKEQYPIVPFFGI